MKAQRARHCTTGSASKTSWLDSFEGQQEQITLVSLGASLGHVGLLIPVKAGVFLFDNLCM